MRGNTISVPLGYSAPGTGLQGCTAPATTTPVFAQKGANGAGFAHERLFLWTVNNPFPFRRCRKGNGGFSIPTPEQVAACPESYTGQYLKKMLERK